VANDKTPAPQRAGTATKTTTKKAERLARLIMSKLEHDPRAIRTVIAMVRLLANRPRSKK